jgi:hypothetical protein
LGSVRERFPADRVHVVAYCHSFQLSAISEHTLFYRTQRTRQLDQFQLTALERWQFLLRRRNQIGFGERWKMAERVAFPRDSSAKRHALDSLSGAL